jgi:hypothetical protein
MNPVDKAIEAISAREAGVFDDPSLLEFGPLSIDTREDVTAIKRACLEQYGFTVGVRDPRLNSDYPGQFMVVESHEECELPTRNGSNGPWCVVGDDLADLIDRGFDFLVSCEPPSTECNECGHFLTQDEIDRDRCGVCGHPYHDETIG